MKYIASTALGVLLITNAVIVNAFSMTNLYIRNQDSTHPNTKCYASVNRTHTVLNFFNVPGDSTTKTGEEWVKLPYINPNAGDSLDILCMHSNKKEYTTTWISICDRNGNSCIPTPDPQDPANNMVSVNIPDFFFNS